jgi:hypothetical protein
MLTVLIATLFVLESEPMCFSSDVQSLCCPAACATRSGPKWSQADDVLRSCAKGIGCSNSETKGASVFMRCNCGARP